MRLFLFVIGLFICCQNPAMSTPLEDGMRYRFNGINVISLSGSHQDMGYNYGKAMVNH